jgi:hypothetical protein
MIQSLRRTAWVLFAAFALATALMENSPARAADSVGTDKSAAPEKLPQQPAVDGAKPAGSDSTGQPAHDSRVVFIVAKNCQRCDEELSRLQRPGGEFEKMRAGGWLIGDGRQNHIQIVDRDQVPELVNKLRPREFPVVACVDRGEVVRSFKSGCTTPLDAWTFGFLAKGIDERPPGTVLEAARVESTGSYPLRGNHWSVEGDWNPTRDKVIQHLRGPNHASELERQWQIDDWSYEELRSLHDDLHERYDAYTTSNSPADTGVKKWKGG